MHHFRPEHELLICIARKSLNDALVDSLRGLATTDIDWGYLLTTASEHKLLPLLYAHLKASAEDLVPRDVLQQLQTAFVDNSQSNLYLMRELLNTLRLFKSNGIRALTFKGPILAVQSYADIALRHAGDLDILIEKSDFIAAKELLKSAGYRMEPELNHAQQQSHLRFHCEIQFFDERDFNVIDLHWALNPNHFPIRLNSDDVFKRSKQISILGQSIETFGDEDLLVYLCIHGAKHFWTKLEWIASVAELIRARPNVDWKAIATRAHEANAETMLHLGLSLARELFAVKLPEEIGRSIDSDRSSIESSRQVIENLFRDHSTPPGQWSMFKSNLRLMDRRRDAVLALTRSFLTPTLSDWQYVNLSPRLHPVYYVVRPFRLIAKYTFHR